MIQQIVVLLIFIGAVAYLGRLVFRSFQAKTVCSSGCGKCSVDFKVLETKLREKRV